ncbi:MAG: hypothetical protein AAB091_01910, partial [Elusimicrobiota bacterium]
MENLMHGAAPQGNTPNAPVQIGDIAQDDAGLERKNHQMKQRQRNQFLLKTAKNYWEEKAQNASSKATALHVLSWSLAIPGFATSWASVAIGMSGLPVLGALL